MNIRYEIFFTKDGDEVKKVIDFSESYIESYGFGSERYWRDFAAQVQKFRNHAEKDFAFMSSHRT
jgi:hypothetical protein